MVREEVDTMHVSTETKARGYLPAGTISMALGLVIQSEDDYDSNLAMTTEFQSPTFCIFICISLPPTVSLFYSCETELTVSTRCAPPVRCRTTFILNLL